MSGERDHDNNNLEVRAFRKDGTIVSVAKDTFAMKLKATAMPTFKNVQQEYGADGLAVYNGYVVMSITHANKLIIADARKKSILGYIAVARPRDICFDKNGRLFMVSGNEVKRFGIDFNNLRLENGKTIIRRGLQDPHRILIGQDHLIYVSDWGHAHQIKIFSASGRLLKTIGKANSGHQWGLYDPLKLSYPAGFTLDGKGHIWIAEAEVAPKRLSEWSGSGSLIKAWYGGPKYGGGGVIDQQDSTRFYYDTRGDGIEYALNWENGTYQVKSIYWRNDGRYEWMPGETPERTVYAKGFQYMTNCFNGLLRWNSDRGNGIWRMDSDHIARPVVIIANAAGFNHPVWGFPMKNKAAINGLWKGLDESRVLFVWCDKNNDHIADVNEIQYTLTQRKDSSGRYLHDIGLMTIINPDLSISTSYGTLISAPVINDQGIPLYDLRKQSLVGNPSWQRSPLVGGNWIVSSEDGKPALLGCTREGTRKWKYYFTPEAEIGGPGMMVSPSRQIAPPMRPKQGETGYFVGIEGEKGAIYLMTMDGLFLQTLGGDMRIFPLWRMPFLRRGSLLDSVSFEDEQFHPTLTRTRDGNIYLVAGKEHSSILQLEGFNSVRRFSTQPLRVTGSMLKGLPATVETHPAPNGRPDLLVARKKGPLVIDGQLDDWSDGEWAPINQKASAALKVSSDTLYVALRHAGPQALDNAGSNAYTLFKYGGGLDLMIGTDPHADKNRRMPVEGDLRLLVSKNKGAIKAVLYRPVTPDTPPVQRIRLSSPVGVVYFDEIKEVSGDIRLSSKDGNYECAIPLSLLGGEWKAGETLLGDIGLLIGNGAQTVRRTYWANKHTEIVSDIPSEAKLVPFRWGFWKIQ